MEDKGILGGEMDLVLAGGVIQVNGRALSPDPYTGFVDATVSCSFPSIFAFGTCLHPQTVANSYQTLDNKNVNFSHVIRSYDPESYSRDKIVGFVVGSEFPQAPDGGWKLTKNTPVGIRCVMGLFKQATGISQFLGSHQTSKKKWSVSIEYNYSTKDSGFMIAYGNLRGGGDIHRIEKTPQDMRELGYLYIPYSAAPKDMLDCWDAKKGVIKKKWNNVDTFLMQGGIGGTIQYLGIALTEYPAEPTARIDQVLAEDKEKIEVNKLLLPLKSSIDFAMAYNQKVLAHLE